jgi:predicted Zn-dependent protease with MMP-like domain
MLRAEFEHMVAETFDRLPERFREAIENVAVVVEDYPDLETIRKMRLRTKHDLLGLYQGVPLTHRGSWYGTSATVPDRISLYQQNIESVSRSPEELQDKVYEVLVHEIGHYFGMDEDEIRAAGF